MDVAPLIHPRCEGVDIGGNIIPSDRDEWRALGECIGRHENVQELHFWNITPTRENLEVLLMGVNQNRTVTDLGFDRCHDEWPLGLGLLFQNNQKLSSLDVSNCGEGIVRSLSAAFRSCTSISLENITCENSQMGDDAKAEFIEALAGLPQLKELNLISCGSTGRRGCDAVAALLRRPACVLEKIWLNNSDINDESIAVLEPAVATSSTLTELYLWGMACSPAALQSFAGVLRSSTCVLKILILYLNNIYANKIGDDTIISFADALATNHRLERLDIGVAVGLDRKFPDAGIAAMTRALCNTSGIGDLHSSNHTLKCLDLDSHTMPDLENYLRMNEREDKSLVAREKILMHFFQGDFSMEPFHESNMTSTTLPHLLGWISRTPDGESITALFNFLRRVREITADLF